MPTFSDGSVPRPAPLQIGQNGRLSPPHDLRLRLQTLLDDKEKQLQQAGTLGQKFLAQQMELEERINQLNELEESRGGLDDEGNPEMREKLEELASTIKSWDAENEQAIGFLTTGSKLNGMPPSPFAPLPSPSAPLDHADDFMPTGHVGPSAAQSSRRAKNAQHRANDVEFAFEIGSSLLTEVRRLQGLLSERDKTIQDMKEENDDLEKSHDALRTTLRQQEASAEKFKEENWNLEVALQEIRSQLSESQESVRRLESDQKRINKDLTRVRESADSYKNDAEKLKVANEEQRAQFEASNAQMRRQNATLVRDKSDLQSTIDSLKAEMATKERAIKRFGPPSPNANVSTPVHTGTPDIFGTGSIRRRADTSAVFTPNDMNDLEYSPDGSPSKPSLIITPSHPSKEIEALKQSLAHAHRQISTLKGSLQREKGLKLEYRRSLNQEKDNEVWLDDDEPPVDLEKSPPKSQMSTPARGRGRGGRIIRGRAPGSARTTLAQRLGMVAIEKEFAGPLRSPDDDEWDDEDLQALTHAPDGQSFPQPTIDDDASPFFEASDRPPSIDGMDPAFANVLRSLKTAGDSSPQRSSPLAPSRQGGTVGRRSRGGIALNTEGRPKSLVGPPSALSAELGDEEPQGTAEILDEILADEAIVPVIQTAEIGIQAEPFVEELPVTPPPPRVETAEIALQTDVPIVPILVDAGVLTEPDVLPVLPVLVEMGIATDPPIEVPKMDIEIQTLPPLSLTVSVQTSPLLTEEVSIQSDPIPEPLPATPTTPTLSVISLNATTQTSTTSTGEMEIQTDPEPSLPPSTVGSPVTIVDHTQLIGSRTGPRPSTFGGVPRPVAMYFDDEADGEKTETETEGEYEDAQMSIAASTPTQSVLDFHSMASTNPSRLTLNDDAGSIRTSRPETPDFEASETTVDRSVSTVVAREPTPPPPKPELVETGIQTDDWVPPVLSPPSPVRPGFVRVGPSTSSAQFQYIASSNSLNSSMATQTTIGPMPASTANAGKTPYRDSSGTFGASRTRSQTPSLMSRSERRPSIESAFSSAADEARMSPRVLPTVPVDKSRPPTMMLPPPPSMPPPATLPPKKMSNGVPPPRPTSPPPAELIQRATTPTFGRASTPNQHMRATTTSFGSSSLLVPGGRGYPRQHGSSMPPTMQDLRQPPSTSSFRSAANAATHAAQANAMALDAISAHETRRQDLLASTASLVSGRSGPSRRVSVSSSRSSENHEVPPLPTNVRTPSQRLQDAQSTDPAVIHAITQTMIGEFMYKYTRKAIGKGYGDKRHRRFFWVHPYTKTLYWSSADPGAANAAESNAKSAYIDDVIEVLDPNPMPPGLHQYSVIVKTPQRDMKFTAGSKERHDMWYSALKYLLVRPPQVSSSPGQGSTGQHSSPHMMSGGEDGVRRDIMASPRSVRSDRSVDSWNITPRADRAAQAALSASGSLGKRPGTPAAEYLRLGSYVGPGAQSPTKSIRSLANRRQDMSMYDDDDYENVDDIANGEFEVHEDDGYEGLENVRACCDGEHDLDTLTRRPGHHHHHHHHHHHSNRPISPRFDTQPASRPVSPAWSFRSRAGSSHSHSQHNHEGSNLFSSLRFGSKRSHKPIPSANQ